MTPVLVPCSGQGGGEGVEPVDLLCSRNARPEKALVGRAQWEINEPILEEITSEHGWTNCASLDGRSGTSTGPIPRRRSKRARRAEKGAARPSFLLPERAR